MQLMHGFKAKLFFAPPYKTDFFDFLGLDRFFAKSYLDKLSSKGHGCAGHRIYVHNKMKFVF